MPFFSYKSVAMVDSQNPYFAGNRPQLAVAQYDVSGAAYSHLRVMLYI